MYNYNELINAYKSNRTDEHLNAIGEWFEHYGTEFWNGECYECKELNGRLFPIYEPSADNEDSFEIVGWELDNV